MTPILLLIIDGMADEAIPELSNLTPLQVAHKPYLDRLASLGQNGFMKTVPDGVEVNSDTALLSILGYDVKNHNYGRAYFEALALGIPITSNESVMRINLTSIKHNTLINFTAQHITTQESRILLEFLNNHFKHQNISFFIGDSYKGIAKIPYTVQSLVANSPHNSIGLHLKELYPTAINTAEKRVERILKKIIDESRTLLSNHPINKQRVTKGLLPANNICLWSFSKENDIKSFNYLHNTDLKGCVITGTDLIKGIGKAVGFDVPQISGATGKVDTNYENKVDYSLKSLTNYDFVLLHIEACDTVSHDGDFRKKTEIIETIDHKVIKPIYNYLLKNPNSFNLAILPDHTTSCITKMHTTTPIPYLIVGEQIAPDSITTYKDQITSYKEVNSSYPDLLIRQLLSLS